MTNDNKRASEAPKRDYYMEKPYDLQIHGVDDIDDEHALADKDKKRVEEIDQGILASMRVHGVVDTVEATKADGIKWVVDGRRRVVHARIVWDEQEKAGVPEDKRILVPTKFVRGENLFLFLRARVHNSGRREESALARGRDAQFALAKGASEADVAASMSTDVVTIRGYLRLVEADDKVKRAVETGKISSSAAMTIAKLKTHEEQRVALDELLASGKATQVEARRVVNQKKTGRDGVGVVSRKVLRELRDVIAEPVDKEVDNDIDERWQKGFVSGLSIVLGDGVIDPEAKKWLHTVQKKFEKKQEKKTAKKAKKAKTA